MLSLRDKIHSPAEALLKLMLMGRAPARSAAGRPMVKIRCSASDRIRVPARPAQHVHRSVPDLRSRTRRSASTIGGGATPDLTIGPAEADQAGARPYLRRCAGTPRKRIRFNLIRNKSLPASPLLERFLDRVVLNWRRERGYVRLIDRMRVQYWLFLRTEMSFEELKHSGTQEEPTVSGRGSHRSILECLST